MPCKDDWPRVGERIIVVNDPTAETPLTDDYSYLIGEEVEVTGVDRNDQYGIDVIWLDDEGYEIACRLGQREFSRL